MTKRLLSLLPVLLFAVGCSGQFSPFSTPAAEIKSMKVGDVSAEGFTMNFGVAISNPNEVDLPVSSADYKVKIAGVGIVNDTAETSASSIPAQGSSNVAIPVHIKFEDLIKAENALGTTGGDVPYDLVGGLDFNPTGFSNLTGTRAVRVPLRYSGTLHLRQLLQDNFETISKSSAAQEILGKLMSSGVGSLLGH